MTLSGMLVAVIAVLVSGAAQAQPDLDWSHNFGGVDGEECYAVTNTSDGGLAMAGFTNSFGAGNSDVWLVRLNSDGDTLWTKTYGDRFGQDCKTVVQTTDGGFAMAGSMTIPGRGDMNIVLIRADSDGEFLWSRNYGGELHEDCYSIVETGDGGFALAGYTTTFGSGYADYWLVRVDSDGDSLWSNTYGGGSPEGCNSLIITDDDGFALAGWSPSFVENGAFWLVKTDSEGDSLWSRSYIGGSNDYYAAMIETSDGGIVLAGSNQLPGRDDSDFWLVRTNADGERLWAKSYGGRGHDFCRSVLETDDGGFALAGWGDPTASGNYDFWLVRADDSGDSLWSRSFGSVSYDAGYSVVQTTNGGFALAGRSSSFGEGDNDFYIVKTTPDPASVSSSLIPYPSSLILEPPFPNPFNSTTRISFSSPINRGATRLAIFDPLGRRVAELIPGSGDLSRRYPIGTHSVVWNAAGFPAGQYVVRLDDGNVSQSQSLLLVR